MQPMNITTLQIARRAGDDVRWKDGDSRLPLERDSSSSTTPAWSY